MWYRLTLHSTQLIRLAPPPPPPGPMAVEAKGETCNPIGAFWTS